MYGISPFDMHRLTSRDITAIREHHAAGLRARAQEAEGGR